MLELRSIRGLRAHPIKERWILSGNSRILHVLSEDILTANVFGTLKNLDPKVWLVSFLRDACHLSKDEFPCLYEEDNFSEFNVSLWLDLDKPPPKLEGPTQADVFVETKNAALLFECKGLAPLQKRGSTDKHIQDQRCWWDQAVRDIVRGYAYAKRHLVGKDFFFVVLSMSEKEKTFSQYENWIRLKEQVEGRMTKDPELRNVFPADSIDEICKKLSNQIRWVKWSDLKESLKKCSFEEYGEFRSQSRFRDDLVDYLGLKINLWTKALDLRPHERMTRISQVPRNKS
jgi:hypothetical protein